ncbi:hypothetical protein [Mycobacteroides abscessus]|uniref:hypothetical protein n=1 Tax=Mycobacteroides abscessus TaxID=36809 RepID=UPI0011B271F8|nr:hypothetical protein [Mycobacteroides abscessus]
MIAVIQGNDGYTIANNGQVLARNLTAAEADELHTALGETLRPVNTGAVTPAKARMRPPIQR